MRPAANRTARLRASAPPALPAGVVSVFLALTAPAPAEGPPARVNPIRQVVKKTEPTVVNISTEEKVENPFHGSFLQSVFGGLFESETAGGRASNSLGSGVVIDERGYILTNEHIVLRASRLYVSFPGGSRTPAEVIGTDPASDLALLKVAGRRKFPSIALGRSSDPTTGETVIAIGNPAGQGSTVTTGVVSAIGRQVKAGDRVYADFIQTDAAVPSGSSGGPLLNLLGDLIGVTTAIHSEGPGLGFAVPADRARKVFEDLLRYGEVRMAWLGLDVRSVPADVDPEGAGLPAGAAVRRVYSGSPAERAGLAAGDVIVGMGSGAISNHPDFDAAVRRLKTDDIVQVTYYRETELRNVAVTAVDFPPELAEAYLSDQIGVELADISLSLRSQSPQLPPDGVIVTRVKARSRGEATGLEEGDVIRRINALPIHDMSSLRVAIPRSIGRGSILMKVARGRNSYYVTLDLS